MTDEEIKQLALDIRAGRVFGSWCISPGDSNLLPSIFIPLALMDEADHHKLIDSKPTHFYEYLDKAGPMAVNGYPIFYSFHTLFQEDSVKLQTVLDRLKKAEEDALNAV